MSKVPQKKRSKLREKAWELFSKYYRLKHADSDGFVTCYTCDDRKHYKDGMQVGHLLDGRANSILFCEDCVRIQCMRCNIHKNGNKENYIPRYIDEMGRDKYDEMVRLKHTQKKYSASDYEEMIADLKEKLKEIQ